MKYDRLWERLIEHLEELGSAREVPGGIEVTFERPGGVSRTVEIVMTSRDWDDFISTMYGTGDPSVTTIRSEVLAVPDDKRYLVYDTYDWEPSATRTVPPDPFLIADPQPRGEWVAVDEEGNVTSRFADWTEDEQL